MLHVGFVNANVGDTVATNEDKYVAVNCLFLWCDIDGTFHTGLLLLIYSPRINVFKSLKLYSSDLPWPSNTVTITFGGVVDAIDGDILGGCVGEFHWLYVGDTVGLYVGVIVDIVGVFVGWYVGGCLGIFDWDVCDIVGWIIGDLV